MKAICVKDFMNTFYRAGIEGEVLEVKMGMFISVILFYVRLTLLVSKNTLY
jgi:hypothetical protein